MFFSDEFLVAYSAMVITILACIVLLATENSINQRFYGGAIFSVLLDRAEHKISLRNLSNGWLFPSGKSNSYNIPYRLIIIMKPDNPNMIHYTCALQVSHFKESSV